MIRQGMQIREGNRKESSRALATAGCLARRGGVGAIKGGSDRSKIAALFTGAESGGLAGDLRTIPSGLSGNGSELALRAACMLERRHRG